MKNSSGYCVVLLSPPSRWSGLKSFFIFAVGVNNIVSTLAVEWIEICADIPSSAMDSSLHPRGGVD